MQNRTIFHFRKICSFKDSIWQKMPHSHCNDCKHKSFMEHTVITHSKRVVFSEFLLHGLRTEIAPILLIAFSRQNSTQFFFDLSLISMSFFYHLYMAYLCRTVATRRCLSSLSWHYVHLNRRKDGICVC